MHMFVFCFLCLFFCFVLFKKIFVCLFVCLFFFYLSLSLFLVVFSSSFSFWCIMKLIIRNLPTNEHFKALSSLAFQTNKSHHPPIRNTNRQMQQTCQVHQHHSSHWSLLDIKLHIKLSISEEKDTK